MSSLMNFFSEYLAVLTFFIVVMLIIFKALHTRAERKKQEAALLEMTRNSRSTFFKDIG